MVLGISRPLLRDRRVEDCLPAFQTGADLRVDLRRRGWLRLRLWLGAVARQVHAVEEACCTVILTRCRCPPMAAATAVHGVAAHRHLWNGSQPRRRRPSPFHWKCTQATPRHLGRTLSSFRALGREWVGCERANLAQLPVRHHCSYFQSARESCPAPRGAPAVLRRRDGAPSRVHVPWRATSRGAWVAACASGIVSPAARSSWGLKLGWCSRPAARPVVNEKSEGPHLVG